MQSAKFNGRTYTKTYLNHDELLKGGTMKFDMADKPNKKWGTAPDDAPYSMTKDK